MICILEHFLSKTEANYGTRIKITIYARFPNHVYKIFNTTINIFMYISLNENKSNNEKIILKIFLFRVY